MVVGKGYQGHMMRECSFRLGCSHALTRSRDAPRQALAVDSDPSLFKTYLIQNNPLDVAGPGLKTEFSMLRARI